MLAMTGQEKIGVLLLALPRETSDALLALMGPERSRLLREEMQRLHKVPQVEKSIDQVVRELDELLSQASQTEAPLFAPSAALQTAPAKNTPAAKKGEEAPNDRNPLTALNPLSADTLTAVLQTEHARTVALVLSNLPSQKAGEVLKKLTRGFRAEVTVQLSRSPVAGPEVLRRLAKTMLARGEKIQSEPKEAKEDRPKRMAGMLRMLDKPERAEIIAALEGQNAELAAAVKDCLYDFDDLLLIEDRSLQSLLAQVESKTLAIALKSAAETIKEKVLKNLSKRAAETLNEEIDLLGFQPPAQVGQARKSIADVIQRLDQSGELVMMSM